MRRWLESALERFQLEFECEEYLLERGAKESSYTSMGVTTWGQVDTASPCELFAQRYGERGSRLRGCLVIPLHSPSGDLIGFEARRGDWKTDYRLPESRWNPTFFGMLKGFPKVWENGTVWIVEGVFDLFAMEWVVPESHALLAVGPANLRYSHLQFLKRYARFVNVVFDNDGTGRKGAAKASEKLGYAKVENRVVKYLGGKDPGEIWDRGGENALLSSFSHVIGGHHGHGRLAR